MPVLRQMTPGKIERLARALQEELPSTEWEQILENIRRIEAVHAHSGCVLKKETAPKYVPVDRERYIYGADCGDFLGVKGQDDTYRKELYSREYYDMEKEILSEIIRSIRRMTRDAINSLYRVLQKVLLSAEEKPKFQRFLEQSPTSQRPSNPADKSKNDSSRVNTEDQSHYYDPCDNTVQQSHTTNSTTVKRQHNAIEAASAESSKNQPSLSTHVVENHARIRTENEETNAEAMSILRNFNKARPRLIKDLDCVSVARIADELMALDEGKGIISGEHWDKIQAEPTEEGKTRRLLDIVRQRGSQAIEVFADVLILPGIEKPQLAKLLVPSKHKSSLLDGMNLNTDAEKIHFLTEEGGTSAPTLADLRTMAIKKLEKIQQEYGKFSYYLWHEKFVIHLNDEKALENRDALINAINDIVQHLLNTQEHSYVVTVSDDSLDAELCTPQIGSILRVNLMDQITGMYLIHRGILHWVSVAHHFVRSPQETLTSVPAGNLPVGHAGREVCIDFGHIPLVAYDGSMVPSPRPYTCLRQKPLDPMGREMMHTVDLMIGPVPAVAPLDINQSPVRLDLLFETHDRERLIYQINRVYRPIPLQGGERNGYVIYDIMKEKDFNNYRNVMTMLPGGNLAEGTIESSFSVLEVGGENYYNALLIASSNDAGPQKGDSGSVWVAKESSKAVAITVGMMKKKDVEYGKVWIAALLFPCLQAFCQEHSQTFASVGEFYNLRGLTLVGDAGM